MLTYKTDLNRNEHWKYTKYFPVRADILLHCINEPSSIFFFYYHIHQPKVFSIDWSILRAIMIINNMTNWYLQDLISWNYFLHIPWMFTMIMKFLKNPPLIQNLSSMCLSDILLIWSYLTFAIILLEYYLDSASKSHRYIRWHNLRKLYVFSYLL